MMPTTPKPMHRPVPVMLKVKAKVVPPRKSAKVELNEYEDVECIEDPNQEVSYHHGYGRK